MESQETIDESFDFDEWNEIGLFVILFSADIRIYLFCVIRIIHIFIYNILSLFVWFIKYRI